MSITTKQKFRNAVTRVTAEVRYDSDYDEWRVELVTNGKVNHTATYFASDKDDAVSTAKVMIA